MHALKVFFDPPGHGPDWLWLVMAFFLLMAIRGYIRQHGGHQ